MQFVVSETSLVLAGAWNPAIINPNWMLRHGLQRQGEEQVQVFVPTGQGMIFEMPKYTIGELNWVVRPDALILAPNEMTEENVNGLEQIAERVLAQLTHTPMTGIGHNFECREPEPGPEVLEVFSSSRQDLADSMPEGWAAAASTLVSSFRNEADTVVLNVRRRFDAGALSINFNFHHPVQSAEQALGILRGTDGNRRMMENFAIARRLINSIYEPQA